MKNTTKNTTVSMLASLTAYVREYGPAVTAAREVQRETAAAIAAMIAALRTQIVAGECEVLTEAQYSALREDFAAPLGYIAPSEPGGNRGTAAYRAHDARNTYYAKTLGLTRLSPNAKESARADARIAEAAAREDGTAEPKTRKARPTSAGVKVKVNVLLVAAVERAKTRGVIITAIIDAINALPGRVTK
jgi:hypothetical protein